MKLPESLVMSELAHGHGAKGMAFYLYEDVDGLGVVSEARRESSRHRFIETYHFKWLPDHVFSGYAALRAAVEALTDEAIAAERANWPKQSAPLRERTGGGSCWLHAGRPATHFGWVETCWIAGCGHAAALCTECAAAAATDLGVIERANQQRKADVLARHGGAFAGMVARG